MQTSMAPSTSVASIQAVMSPSLPHTYYYVNQAQTVNLMMPNSV